MEKAQVLVGKYARRRKGLSYQINMSNGDIVSPSIVELPTNIEPVVDKKATELYVTKIGGRDYKYLNGKRYSEKLRILRNLRKLEPWELFNLQGEVNLRLIELIGDN